MKTAHIEHQAALNRTAEWLIKIKVTLNAKNDEQKSVEQKTKTTKRPQFFI